MEQVLKAFISYRRQDKFMQPEDGGELDFAFIDKLADALRLAGFDDVFVDRSAIRGGENYDTRIRRDILECDLFVAVIGESWLDIMRNKRDTGERDAVAREIQIARRKEKPIVPLLVDGATMPRPIDLPEKIRRFHYQNAFRSSPRNRCKPSRRN